MKVDSLEKMKRGTGGFRSTGEKGKAPLHIKAILKRLKKIEFDHEFLDYIKEASNKDWLYTEILNINDPTNKEEIDRVLFGTTNVYKFRIMNPFI